MFTVHEVSIEDT